MLIRLHWCVQRKACQHLLQSLNPAFAPPALSLNPSRIQSPQDDSVCPRPRTRAPWVFFSFSVWLSPFCSHQAHMWHLEPHNSWHIGLECLPVASHPRPLDHLGWRWELSPPFPQHTYIHRHKHTHIHKHSTYTQMCIHTHAYKHTDIYIPPPPPPPGWGVGLREKTETFICF